MYTQGDKDGAEKVWYCTEKSKCKWQGFALNAGLSWGELKNTTAEWQKYHSQFCKGTLVQGVIVDQQYETRALKEQMERVIGVIEEKMKELTSTINSYQCPQQVPTAYLAQLYALKALKAELEENRE